MYFFSLVFQLDIPRVRRSFVSFSSPKKVRKKCWERTEKDEVDVKNDTNIRRVTSEDFRFLFFFFSFAKKNKNKRMIVLAYEKGGISWRTVKHFNSGYSTLWIWFEGSQKANHDTKNSKKLYAIATWQTNFEHFTIVLDINSLT